MTHVHQWGALLVGTLFRGKRRAFRLCVNGYCSRGRYEQSRHIFVARPGRVAR